MPITSVFRGRIGFDLPTWFVPADDKQKPTSAFFAGAIVIFDKPGAVSVLAISIV
jgi:hypothetical protein